MTKSINTKTMFNKSDIAAIALYQLGGSLRYIHHEDVAIKASQLSPKMFSWEKYPEQINLEMVRLALKNESAKVGGRVSGGIRDGWMLTPHGLSWCLAKVSGASNKFPREQIHKEITRMTKNETFNKVVSNKASEITDNDLKALIRIDEYFSARNRSERIMALANVAVIEPKLKQILITLKDRGLIKPEVEL